MTVTGVFHMDLLSSDSCACCSAVFGSGGTDVRQER